MNNNDLKITNMDLPSRKKKSKIHPLLPCIPHRWIMAAPSNSGKTNFIINLLTKKEFYKGIWKPQNIIIFSRTAHLDDKIKQIKADNFFNEYSEDIMKEIIEQQEDIISRYGSKKAKRKMPHVLIVFDDMLNTKAMANNSLLSHDIQILRHYKISIWISTQKYSGVPRNVRLNANVMTLWRPYNMNELDHILEEHSNKSNKKKMEAKLMEIFSEPYQFFHIEYSCFDLNKRYRKGFNEFLNLFKMS